ncbi:hypothetical protein ACFFRR_007599 [Megaselia abdita]
MFLSLMDELNQFKIQELPSHVRENIFKFLPTSKLKAFSLVCWDWYHEIAMILKRRISINIEKFGILQRFQLSKSKSSIESSKRYYENLKIPLARCLESTSGYLESIDLIRNRALTYTNTIRNVIFFGDIHCADPLKFVDIFSALGDQIISVDFESSFIVCNTWDKPKCINGKELKDCKYIFKNLRVLKLSNIGLQRIATFCTNLETLRMCIRTNTHVAILNKVVLYNANIRNLSLHVSNSASDSIQVESLQYLKELELNGDNFEVQKTLMRLKFDELLSLIINNCGLENKDFKAMERNYQHLRTLHLKFNKNIKNYSQSSLLHCCWGLKHLKEIKLEIEGFDEHPFNTTCSTNESLDHLILGKMLMTKEMLEEFVKITPNMKKLCFLDMELDFFVDNLFEILKKACFIEHLIFDQVTLKSHMGGSTHVKQSSIPSLKIMEINRATEASWSILHSRTFKVLNARNLESLVVFSNYQVINKKIIDAIPSRFPNLRKLTFISPQMLLEPSFKSIIQKYSNITEFNYLFGGSGSCKSPIYCDILKIRVRQSIYHFMKSPKNFKFSHIFYNAKVAIKCRCKKAVLTRGCLWNFYHYLKSICEHESPPFDLKTEQPEPGLTKFIISGRDKILELSTSRWGKIRLS